MFLEDLFFSNHNIFVMISKETCVAVKGLARLNHDLPGMLLFFVCLPVPFFDSSVKNN